MIWILFILAVLWRFQDLGLKAVHHDESINGWFVMQIWEKGWFQYDPTNYHGPLHFYMLALAERLGGFGIESFRFVTAFFSALWLIYLWRFWKREEWGGKWILILVALSPGFFFFGRSAIHEMPFLFFMTLGMGGLYRLFHREDGQGWVSLIWGTAGMICLKETWALMAAALVLAGFVLYFISPDARREMRDWKKPFQLWPRFGTLHLILGLIFVVLMFTGFGAYPRGLVDMIAAYLPWMKTGVHGSGHEKPFTYWLSLLWQFEKPLFFIFLGTAAASIHYWKYLSQTCRWMLLASLIQLLFYSWIPYKTPWCMIAVFGPMVFAVGSLRGDMKRLGVLLPMQAAFSVLAVGALYFQWDDFTKLNFKDPTQKSHPYIYVQTDQRLKTLVDAIYKKAEENPALYKEDLQFAGTEAWPLAWWLSPFASQTQKALKEGWNRNAWLVVVDASDEKQASELMPLSQYQVFRFPIRDGREDSLFFIRKESAEVEVKL